jgi:hypothetical protein
VFVRDGICTQSNTFAQDRSYVKYHCADDRMKRFSDEVSCRADAAGVGVQDAIPGLGSCVVQGKQSTALVCGGQKFALHELTTPVHVDNPAKGIIKPGAVYDSQLYVFNYERDVSHAYVLQVINLSANNPRDILAADALIGASSSINLKLLVAIDGTVPSFDHFFGFRHTSFEKQGDKVIIDPNESHIHKHCRPKCRIIVKIFSDKAPPVDVHYAVHVTTQSPSTSVGKKSKAKPQ